jgi:hypothetical protein
MPFKDINLQELNKSLEASQKFYKNTAIINARQKGDLNKLEFLTGKDLATTDPIVEALFETTPIGKKLESINVKTLPIDYNEIGRKIAMNVPAIDYDRFANDFANLLKGYRPQLHVAGTDQDDQIPEIGVLPGRKKDIKVFPVQKKDDADVTFHIPPAPPLPKSQIGPIHPTISVEDLKGGISKLKKTPTKGVNQAEPKQFEIELAKEIERREIAEVGKKLPASQLDVSFHDFYEETGFPKISEIYLDNNRVKEIKTEINNLRSEYTGKYGKIETSPPDIQALRKKLTEYSQALVKANKDQELYQTGTGIKSIKLKYGKYYVDFPKLKKNNILSISYANNKKVNGYPNMIVSEAVKTILLNNKINKKCNLSEAEKIFLRSFFKKSGANSISSSKKKTVGGCTNIYFADLNTLKDRYSVLIGEFAAGNESKQLFNELTGIAEILYQKGVLTLE